jgi:hypothetical protein
MDPAGVDQHAGECGIDRRARSHAAPRCIVRAMRNVSIVHA